MNLPSLFTANRNAYSVKKSVQTWKTVFINEDEAKEIQRSCIFEWCKNAFSSMQMHFSGKNVASALVKPSVHTLAKTEIGNQPFWDVEFLDLQKNDSVKKNIFWGALRLAYRYYVMWWYSGLQSVFLSEHRTRIRGDLNFQSDANC